MSYKTVIANPGTHGRKKKTAKRNAKKTTTAKRNAKKTTTAKRNAKKTTTAKRNGTKAGQKRKTARRAFSDAPLTTAQFRNLAKLYAGRPVPAAAVALLERRGLALKNGKVSAKGKKTIKDVLALGGIAAGEARRRNPAKKLTARNNVVRFPNVHNTTFWGDS